MENTSFNFSELTEKIKGRFSNTKMVDGKKVIISIGIKKETYNKTLIGLGVSILVAVGMIGYIMYQHMSLNSQLDQLNSLKNYDLVSIRSNPLLA